MPFDFQLPIPNTENSVVRPVVFQAVKQLMREGMVPCNETIEFNRVNDKRKLSGRTLCKRAAILKCKSFVSITATEDFVVNDDHYVRFMKDHVDPLWVDENHGLSVSCINDLVKMRLVINIVSDSLSTLREWKNSVRIRQRRGRQRQDITLEYAMSYPRRGYDWFCDMYNLTDASTRDDTLRDMILRYGSAEHDIISAGTSTEIVVSQSQINAMGTITATNPTIEKIDNGVYRASIPYLIEYSKPIGMQFMYPIMVKQHLVPKGYIPYPKPIPDIYANNNFDVETPLRRIATRAEFVFHHMRIPNEDTLALNNLPPYYTPLLTVLCSLDKDNPKELFNLKELGEIELEPNTLEVIQKFYLDEILKHRHCPYMLTLHESTRLLDEDSLEVDSDLNVKLVKDPDMSGIYRVSFNILLNTSVIPQSAWVGLRTNKFAVANFVKQVNVIEPSEAQETVNYASVTTHGINRTVLESDIMTMPYLTRWSPLVKMSETYKRDPTDPYDYITETEYQRGTADHHTWTKTVETLNTHTQSYPEETDSNGEPTGDYKKDSTPLIEEVENSPHEVLPNPPKPRERSNYISRF